MSFWNGEHPLSNDYQHLYDELVPLMGKCDTLQGELLRAASKIGYDWYNNGWGCNNWSGAVVFLQQNIGYVASHMDIKQRQEYTDALRFVYQFSHGEQVHASDELIEKNVTLITESVVKFALKNPVHIPNDFDMLDLSEPDAPYEEDYDYDEEEY